MGKIYNDTLKGDPLGEVHIYGFGTFEDANKFVVAKFEIGDIPYKFKGIATRDEPPVEFLDTPHAVFYYYPSPNAPTLCAIVRVFGDLPGITIKGWGAQFLISRGG